MEGRREYKFTDKRDQGQELSNKYLAYESA
jgi:hypothetical protein